jgi:hypothetical protein
MKSEVQRMGAVSFPEHTGERIYMVPFVRQLPRELSRWQPTVDQMLYGLRGEGPCYLMVDQNTVRAGASHRRPGLHVDGNWVEPLRCHGNPPGHVHARGRWDNPKPYWNHFEYAPETIVLAADVIGAVAYAGEFEADIGPGGEVETDLLGMRAVPLEAGIAWAGNVTMLHESIPLAAETRRTVVRINAPGYYTSVKEADPK